MDKYIELSDAMIYMDKRGGTKKEKRANNKRARASLKEELRAEIFENDTIDPLEFDDCGTDRCKGCYNIWLQNNHYDDE